MSEGKHIVVYLDDGNYAETKLASDNIRADFITSGFVPNMHKSKWEPPRTLEWLGYDIDLNAGSFSVSGRRINDIYQGTLEFFGIRADQLQM